MTHPRASVIPLPHDGTLPNALKTLKKSKFSVDGHSDDELVSSALEGRKRSRNSGKQSKKKLLTRWKEMR